MDLKTSNFHNLGNKHLSITDWIGAAASPQASLPGELVSQAGEDGLRGHRAQAGGGQPPAGGRWAHVTCHVSRVTTVAECDEAPGFIAHILTIISLLLICVTFPLSLCWVVKVRPRVTCHVSQVTCHACPGGAGVRARGGVPAGSDADRQGAGPGRLLRDSLHRHVREDRPEDPDIRRPSPGGQTRAVTPQILSW